jgi:hypothetical protein
MHLYLFKNKEAKIEIINDGNENTFIYLLLRSK